MAVETQVEQSERLALGALEETAAWRMAFLWWFRCECRAV